MAGLVTFTLSGSTSNTQRFLERVGGGNLAQGLESLAQRGVAALQSSTPTESGLTAASWGYEITTTGGYTTIAWTNDHIESGVNIAVILQYGHGTGTGGYVAGRDYINPAIQPIFDEIANELWKKVTTA
jgi:hypothetical protein